MTPLPRHVLQTFEVLAPLGVIAGVAIVFLPSLGEFIVCGVRADSGKSPGDDFSRLFFRIRLNRSRLQRVPRVEFTPKKNLLLKTSNLLPLRPCLCW